MRINFNSTKINTFGETPIYPIKLKKKSGDRYKLVRASFSELSSKDKNDYVVMSKVTDNWVKHSQNYVADIADDFFRGKRDKKLFATNLNLKAQNLYNKLTSLVLVTNPNNRSKKEFNIFFIQTKPELIENANIKGAGEVGIYGALKLAKDNKFKKVKIHSSNDSFYDKLGIPKVGVSEEESLYEISHKRYNEFLKKIASKYSIRHD